MWAKQNDPKDGPQSAALSDESDGDIDENDPYFLSEPEFEDPIDLDDVDDVDLEILSLSFKGGLPASLVQAHQQKTEPAEDPSDELPPLSEDPNTVVFADGRRLQSKRTMTAVYDGKDNPHQLVHQRYKERIESERLKAEAEKKKEHEEVIILPSFLPSFLSF